MSTTLTDIPEMDTTHLPTLNGSQPETEASDEVGSETTSKKRPSLGLATYVYATREEAEEIVKSNGDKAVGYNVYRMHGATLVREGKPELFVIARSPTNAYGTLAREVLAIECETRSTGRASNPKDADTMLTWINKLPDIERVRLLSLMGGQVAPQPAPVPTPTATNGTVNKHKQPAPVPAGK